MVSKLGISVIQVGNWHCFLTVMPWSSSPCICFVQFRVLCLMRMSSAESHLGLLDSIVRSAERLCQGELCCLGHRRKISALCLLYEVHHRVDHPINEYLNHFVAGCNTRASAALGKLVLVIHRCKTDNSVGCFSLLLFAVELAAVRRV